MRDMTRKNHEAIEITDMPSSPFDASELDRPDR